MVETIIYVTISFMDMLVRNRRLSDKKFSSVETLEGYRMWVNTTNIGLTIPGNWSFEIRRISPLKSIWNPADFTWNLYEIRRISWNVSFCVMIKYRSFFQKTNQKGYCPRQVVFRLQ